MADTRNSFVDAEKHRQEMEAKILEFEMEQKKSDEKLQQNSEIIKQDKQGMTLFYGKLSFYNHAFYIFLITYRNATNYRRIARRKTSTSC